MFPDIADCLRVWYRLQRILEGISDLFKSDICFQFDITCFHWFWCVWELHFIVSTELVNLLDVLNVILGLGGGVSLLLSMLQLVYSPLQTWIMTENDDVQTCKQLFFVILKLFVRAGSVWSWPEAIEYVSCCLRHDFGKDFEAGLSITKLQFSY